MVIRAQYSGTCRRCGGAIRVGSEIEWTRGGGASHIKCPVAAAPAETDSAVAEEIRYEALGDLDVGQIWANKRHGIFVVVSSRPAVWRGEDRDVYAHIDTWYTIRPANETETALYQAALDAAAARRELRAKLGTSRSVQFDAAKGQLVSNQRMLDSYDDRWTPPGDINLDGEAVAIEQGYVDALNALHRHA